MSLKGIISISGKGGLYKVIGQGKNSVIVQSLEDGRKFPAFSSNKISALEDITIYTNDDDKPLEEIYASMFKELNGKEGPSHKDDMSVLREFLSKLLPDYDRERVTDTDVKKLFQWYTILIKAEVLKEAEEEENKEEENKKEAADKKQPATTAKKPSSKKDDSDNSEEA